MTDTETTQSQAGTMKLLTLSLILESQEAPETRSLDTPEALAELEAKPFDLPEGAHYKIRLTFQVEHGTISGVKATRATYRKGIRVGEKEAQMLGSFSPPQASDSVTLPRHGRKEAPSGSLGTAIEMSLDEDAKSFAESRSFSEPQAPHEVAFPRHGWEEVPSGMLHLGSYTAKDTFHDDDNNLLAEYSYAYKITSA
jgi:RHO protein GDP dissociation inhibitor